MNKRGQPKRLRAYSICYTAIGCAFLVLQSGCFPKSIGGSGESVHTVVRKLRLEREQLLQDKKVLEQTLAIRDREISALKDRLNGQSSKVPHVDSDYFPRVVQIKFNAFSGGVDKDHDGVDEFMRVYLVTLDQRGRFFPAVGRAKLVALHRRNGQKTLTVAEQSFEPKELNKTYRTGFLGSHYRLDVKFDPPLPSDAKDLTVKVVFTDAASGIDFEFTDLLVVKAPTRQAAKPDGPPPPRQ